MKSLQSKIAKCTTWHLFDLAVPPTKNKNKEMKFLYFHILTFIVSCTAHAPKTQTSETIENCLNYEPAKVQLEGLLYRKSFPGPPNYTDVKKGDEEEVYWLLKTTVPFCVNEDEKIWGEKLINLSNVQLIICSETGFYNTKRALLNKKVIATGTLIPQITGHHKTEVLLDVQVLDEAKE
jgi:hypothetical protein